VKKYCFENKLNCREIRKLDDDDDDNDDGKWRRSLS
jgi:hypothetical protein